MESSEIIIRTLEKENALQNMATIREKDLKKYKELENEKNLIANENKILKDENMEIRAQLDSILYSRSYKITQKIKKIIKR